VSTSQQADEDRFGLEVQRASVTAHSRDAGYRLVTVLADEGESGSNGLDTRDALAEALRMLRAGEADVLVLPRLDRLARDVVLQEQLLREVWNMGRTVESCARGENGVLVDDPDDPSRRLIRTVLGAVSEYERAMIRLRMRSGLRRKAAEGGWTGGLAPYGQRAQGRTLVKDSDETKLVATIKRLHTQGRSYRQICDELEAAGWKTRQGGRWQPAVVRRIAQRSAAIVAATTKH
jgi:DNA invertase Pin-like site-specific DNA recombinase